MTHVFISYSHADADFVTILKNRLEEAEISVWIDDERLKTGDDWRQGIDDAIRTAYAMIIVLSPDSDKSKYVTYEWACAWGAEIPLLPILVRETERHPRLESWQHLNFTSRVNRPWAKLITEIEGYQKEFTGIVILSNAPKEIREILKSLNSWNPDTRCDALTALHQRNYVEAIPSVVYILQNDSDYGVRATAAYTLGKLGGDTEIDDLINSISDDHSYVRKAVIQALGNMQAVGSIDLLIEELHNSSNENDVRETAALALCNIGGEEVVRPLILALEYHKEGIDEAAAKALSVLGTDEAVHALIEHFHRLPKGLNFLELSRGDLVRLIGLTNNIIGINFLINALNNTKEEFWIPNKEVVRVLKQINTPESIAAVAEWEKHQNK